MVRDASMLKAPLSGPRIGPEKGVIHIATGAVVNALWDLYARLAQKPLWRLIAEFTPEEFVRSTSFRHVASLVVPCVSPIQAD
jgi:L-fuconate dehydratase